MLEALPDADLAAHVVWTDVVATDDAAGAAGAAAIFDDPRVTQYHDPERRLGRAVAEHVGMPSLAALSRASGRDPVELERAFLAGFVHGEPSAFDTVLLYGPGAAWPEGAPPPAPDDWLTQLDPDTWLGVPRERFRWGEAFGEELRRRVVALLAAAGGVDGEAETPEDGGEGDSDGSDEDDGR